MKSPRTPQPLLIHVVPPSGSCERCGVVLPECQWSVKAWQDERPDGFWRRVLLRVCADCATDPAWAAERDALERANVRGKLLTWAVATGRRKGKATA